MPEQPSNLKFWLLTCLVVLLVMLPISYFVGRIAGVHTGEEFSADDFTSRRFSYEIFPFTGWVMRGIEYENTTPEICELIIADKLIQPTGDQLEWALIRGGPSNESGPDCDARLLVDYLNQKDDSQSVFAKWTEDHPNCAKVFWPVVAELARADMYLAAPDIMEFAKLLKEDDAESFEQELYELTAKAYLDLGVLDQQMENHDRAIDRLTRSIKLKPTGTAHDARAESYQATGKADLADRDRQFKEAG